MHLRIVCGNLLWYGVNIGAGQLSVKAIVGARNNPGLTRYNPRPIVAPFSGEFPAHSGPARRLDAPDHEADGRSDTLADRPRLP